MYYQPPTEEESKKKLDEYWENRDKKSIWQHILCWIFSKVYARWLWDDDHKMYKTVVKVKGWRTALVESKYETRYGCTPCFKIFGLKFD